METTPEANGSQGTLFAALVSLVEKLERTSKRLEKRRLIADFLKRLRPGEASPAVLLLIAGIFPESDSKKLNIGFATLQKTVALASAPGDAQLTIADVQRKLEDIAAASGPDSARARRELLLDLFTRAPRPEQEIIARSILGEMRIGVNEGIMLEAIGDAAALPAEVIRNSNMFLGDLGRLAEIALFQSPRELENIGLRVLYPVKPMLADLATDLDEVLEEHGGRTAIEYKIDGARIQIHRSGSDVRVFTRRLSEVTKSLPEIVDFARSLPASTFVLEGEVLAVDGDRPRSFQELMRRFRRIHDVDALRQQIPLRLYLFDLLHLSGQTLIAKNYEERWAALQRLVPESYWVPRITASERGQIEAFLKQALAAGHEGLMAKRLDSTYSVGKRGKKWFKIKPAESLDVAILAAEWGHGRRTGTLSNYWLGVRDGAAWQMVGKTFKGLTDAERLQLMERLLPLKTTENAWVMHFRPEVIVEVAYNEIQRSPRYPSQFALRFARVTRIREDKGPNDADTYERLKELYGREVARKAGDFHD